MTENGKIYRIAWDGDGVLINSWESVLGAVSAKLSQVVGHEIVLDKSFLTSWDAISVRVAQMTGDAALASRLESFWFDSEVLRDSPPNPAMVEVFNRCQELPRTEQYLITTRNHACGLITRQWLDTYLPSVDWETHLYMRKPGDSLGGDDYKINKLGELGIHHMTEDNTGTVTRIVNELPHCRASYVNQPWNLSDTDPCRSLLRVPCDDADIAFNRIQLGHEKFFA